MKTLFILMGIALFVMGAMNFTLANILIMLTTQQGQADYPAAMYFIVSSIAFMYFGRSLIAAAWAIDKNP